MHFIDSSISASNYILNSHGAIWVQNRSIWHFVGLEKSFDQKEFDNHTLKFHKELFELSPENVRRTEH